MEPLVWLVTGSTSPIGLALVQTIASRGDRAIATGRSATTRLAHLFSPSVHLLDLDVAAPREAIDAAVATAVAVWGRIDVLINNAGASAAGPLEKVSEGEIMTLFDANLFGALHVTQAVLPHMRARGSGGKIGFVGTGFAWAPLPFLGCYAMAKAALGVLAETLQKEVGRFGIDAVVFELGGFESGAAGKSREQEEKKQGGDDAAAAWDGGGGLEPSGAYADAMGRMFARFGAEVAGDMVGDVEKLGDLVVDVMKGEGRAKGKKWAVRVPVGADSVAVVRQKCREQLQLCDEWEEVTSIAARDEWSGDVSQFVMDECSMLSWEKKEGAQE